MEFRKVKNPKEYNDFLTENNASFTQSYFYADWHKENGTNVHAYVVYEDEKVLAYIQLIEVRVSGNQTFLYAPYGPVIVEKNKENTLKFLKKELEREVRILDAVFLRMEIGSNNTPKFTHKGSFFQPRAESVLNLTPITEEIFKKFHSKTRYSVRLAEKRGVEVEIIKNNLLDYFEDFYSLMKDTANRNSFCLHNRKYYEAIFNSIVQNQNGFLIKTTLNKKTTGYLLMIEYGKTVMYLLGASSDAERKVPSAHLGHWKAIQYAKENNFLNYNFGGISTKNFPNSSLESLTRFKEKFGGTTIEHSGFYDIRNKKIFYFLFLIKKLLNHLRNSY